MLRKITSENDFDVILLQETFTKKEECTYRLQDYKGVLKSREDGHGGLAIYVKENIRVEIIEFPNLKYIEVLAIEFKNNKYFIINLYAKPQLKSEEFKSDLKKILIEVEKYRDYVVIVGGDFNAHHSDWGNNFSQPKGEITRELIVKSDLLISNNGSRTLLNNNTLNNSAVDLTLISKEVYRKADWDVVEDNLGSDHLCIRVRVGRVKEKVGNKIKLINTKNIMEIIKKRKAGKHCRIHATQIVKENTKKIVRDKKLPKYWWNKELDVL